MNQNYIIYNPSAGDGNGKEEAEILYVVYPDSILININRIRDYRIFLSGMDTSDRVILCGGDGTLNRFVNSSKDIDIKSEIYFYSAGNGNDFVQDLGKDKGCTPDFEIYPYIKELPSVRINGEQRLFINGIGYGMNGFCMKTSDADSRSRRQNRFSSKVDAVRGFLFQYKPIDMTITMDGKSYIYKKVWLAYTMKGRYLGGVMVAPEQNRLDESKKLSFVVVHGVGRWKALRLFLSMINGKHAKGKKGVEMLRGKKIHVSFGEPVSVQLDGDMVTNVQEYITGNVNF